VLFCVFCVMFKFGCGFVLFWFGGVCGFGCGW